MDIPQLAAEVAKFLAPFLPYLIAGTKAAADEAGKQFGKAAWDQAARLAVNGFARACFHFHGVSSATC